MNHWAFPCLRAGRLVREARVAGGRARVTASGLAAGLLAGVTLFGSAVASAGDGQFFRRIGVFPVFLNTGVDLETSAEIIASANDGTLLIYTDAPAGSVGFIDITDPAAPKAAGSIDLSADPTSVAVVGGFALVAVNTSTDFVNVSGYLAVIDTTTLNIVQTIDLGGQPDSISISPDGAYAAVAIENERDEDLGNGKPPQLPPGKVVIVDLVGPPAAWTTRDVDLVGVPLLFPEDPEPEFVDINDDNIAVVTLQENNHIVLIDLPTGTVVGHFEAGTVDLDQIDVIEDELIDLSGSLRGVPREPDAIAWVSNDAFFTADEGDLFGGSRGFTGYRTDGTIFFEAGNTLEHLAVRIGHYPESRSENKGSEPESVLHAVYGESDFLFVGSERGSFIAVYSLGHTCAGDLDGNGAIDGADLGLLLNAWAFQDVSADLNGDGMVGPEDLKVLLAAWGACAIDPAFIQVLPAGLSPEGLHAIPERNLFVVASEVDARAEGVRATVSIYQLGDISTYPDIVSADRVDGTPIPWAALSGLAAEPSSAETAYAIYDSYYVRSRIYTLDLGAVPAVITDELELSDANGVVGAALAALKLELPDTPDFDPAAIVAMDGSVNLDPEGIAVGIGGGYWVASEGAGNLADGVSNPRDRPFASPNLLVRCDVQGIITGAILPPIELTRNQFRFGFEGVAAVEENGIEVLYVAFQRRWAATGDPANRARIGRVDTSTGEWTFAYYPLEVPTSPNGGWVGLSEITALGDGRFAVIERDNQAGPDATIKRVYSFSIDRVEFVSNADVPAFPIVAKELDRDLIAAGDYDAGFILEKLEGLAVLADGRTVVVNDNDGVDGSNGETRIFDLGQLFAPRRR